MTIPAAAASGVSGAGQRSAPTRIGQARPSHLITTAGVGATVDLPSMSVIVRGLDAWNPEHQDPVDEPRLLEAVQRVLGPQVRALRHAPWDPDANDDPLTRTGVPVTPFPRWVRCPRCYRLGPLDPPGQFELVHRWGRRPDLAKYVHAQCLRQASLRVASRRACVPARFLVVCEDGHLDDFPYVDFVHATRAEGVCDGPQLTMSDAASTLGPRVTVRCVTCDHSRSIQEAAGSDGWQKLPVCRGRHPHLQRFYQCGKQLKLIVLGASNLWFAVSASALHLPQGQTVEDLVAAHWDILGSQPSSRSSPRPSSTRMAALRGLRGYPIDEVWGCIEKLRGAGRPHVPESPDNLRDAEWQLLSRPTTERQDADFRAVPTDSPRGYDSSSTRWSWSRGCARSAPCSGSPGCPRRNATSCGRSAGSRSHAARRSGYQPSSSEARASSWSCASSTSRDGRRPSPSTSTSPRWGGPTGSGRWTGTRRPRRGSRSPGSC